MQPIILFMFVLSFVLIGGFIYVLLNARKQSVAIYQDVFNPGTEQVTVLPSRVTIVGGALFFAGFIFSAFGLFMLFSGIHINLFFYLFPILMCALGGYAMYGGSLVYMMRDHAVQLELTSNEIRYKPVKWYSTSRGGGYNGLSIFFCKEWCSKPYSSIQNVILYESMWTGNYINLVTRENKTIRLILIIDSVEQMREITSKIKSRLENKSGRPLEVL